jgi:hypothetical protein
MGAMVVYVGPAVGLTQEREDHESGPYLYRVSCVVCHSDSGRGDGPVSDILRPPAPDRIRRSARSDGVVPEFGARA